MGGLHGGFTADNIAGPYGSPSITILLNREFVADSVIQASGTVEFEDGLRTGVLQEDCWCPYGVRTNPLVNVRAPMWQGMTLGEVWMGIYVHSANQTPTVMSRIVADSLTEMRWQQWCKENI